MTYCSKNAKWRYEMMCLLMKTNRRNVRERMKRQGLTDSAEDMVKYIRKILLKKMTNGLDERDFVRNKKISGSLDKGSDVKDALLKTAGIHKDDEDRDKDNGGRLNKGDGVKSALLNEGWEQEDNGDNEMSYVGEDQMDEW